MNHRERKEIDQSPQNHTIGNTIQEELSTTIQALPSIKGMQILKEEIADIFTTHYQNKGIDKNGHDISDNILGDAMSEIALYIRQEQIDKAQYLREIIESIHTNIINNNEIENIAHIFEYLRNKKLGRNGQQRYVLKEGENRLLMVKSAIDLL